MITIQVIPRGGRDAYKLLRHKVIHEAQTWSWANKAKTRLSHTRKDSGYIEVSSADNVLIAQLHPQDSDPYFLVEKFVGRLVAWFEPELFAINIQFIPDEKKKRK
ncbi:MAG: hypothetical protein HY581_12615 [Nitrospirae bacterium]|nr:hypothetical protein [Nitrospirota bacterium]